MWLDSMCGGTNGTLQRKIKSVFVNRICFCVSKQKRTWIQQLQWFSYSLSSLAMVFCSTQACLQILSSYNNLECIHQGRRERGGKSNFGSTDHAQDTKYMLRHLKPTWNLLYNEWLQASWLSHRTSLPLEILFSSQSLFLHPLTHLLEKLNYCFW